jgi:mxaK protein
MMKHMKISNLLFATLSVLGLLGTAYALYNINQMEKVNQLLKSEQLVKDDAYPYLQKFTAAYDQGNKQDYKHAVQTYGQLLETKPTLAQQASIQYNIGNNLFVFGLIRRVNDDGTLQDEARYAYTQAKLAYEQALRVDPEYRVAKFNLGLLHSVMANNMKPAPKDQSTMELSNLPIGLP